MLLPPLHLLIYHYRIPFAGAASTSGMSSPANVSAPQQSVGHATCPSSVSVGRELSAAAGATTPTNNSATDDCTDAFRDNSLNISLTLGLPSSTTNQNLSSNCTEHTYLKRSWLLVQQPPHGQRCRVQRLRHTFSSPEAFGAHEPNLNLPYPDFLSYGTNMPHERSSSNFGSELSRDPSSYSFGKRARLAAAEQSDCHTLTPMPTPTPTTSGESSVQTLQSEMTLSRRDLLSDREAEQQVSCFGAVSQRPKRRRVRSRSFSSSGRAGSGARRRLRQRSSSADLLIYANLESDSMEGKTIQRLFFI